MNILQNWAVAFAHRKASYFFDTIFLYRAHFALCRPLASLYFDNQKQLGHIKTFAPLSFGEFASVILALSGLEIELWQPQT
jgi:hypothetical protein